MRHWSPESDLIHGIRARSTARWSLSGNGCTEDMPDDKDAAVRWFFETIFALREELDDAEFDALRAWLEFVADEQAVAH